MGGGILARLGLAILLIVIGVGLYWGWNKLQLRRLGRRGQKQDALRGLEVLRAGVPGVLYFTTPDCHVCLTAQRPALQRLQADLGDGLQVIEVDASAHTNLADYWGVLSVPTTFIIGTDGRPHSLNHGLTSKEKLLHQIQAAEQVAAAVPVAEDRGNTLMEKLR